MKRAAVALIGGLSVALAACNSAAGSSPREIHARGTMTITDPAGAQAADGSGATSTGTACTTLGGYTDIAEGAEVVISDDSGKTLAVTSLGAGSYDVTGGCEFPFSATVPAGKGFYGVTVTHRGTVKQPEAEMGAISLTLGS